VYQFDRACFDHVGFVTDTPQPGEIYHASEGCYDSDPRHHPASIEWIRWEPGSLHRDDRPHVAFRVPDIEAAVAGQRVVVPPTPTSAGARYAFVERPDRGLIELLEYDDPNAPGWGGRQP
jgi:catechol 2,3-dioxygenase-like lactoylglutathione lyase family enzyme